jgi:glycosyltransferase involved in cell wall biosynthesis
MVLDIKKLRICMICSEFPPNCAGIGNNVHAISRALVSKGHEVTVLTRGNIFFELRSVVDGINVIRLPFISFPPPFHLIYHGYFINKKLKQIQKDYDLIHLHSPLVPEIKSSLPKIVSVHSLWLEEAKHFDDSKDFYALAIRLFKKQVIQSEKNTINQANAIFSYSEFEKSFLNQYGIKLPPIYLLSGIIQSDFDLNIDSKKEYDIVFVGRLNPRKGVKEIMLAASLVVNKIPNARFLIIGEGVSRRWMEAEAEKKGLKNNFIFLGFVLNEKVAGYLRKSKIAIVPSRYEPFGIVTGEAMICGLPVVGTRAGGTESMVQDKVTGYLTEVGDYKALADRIVDLLLNEEKAIQMGQLGKKRIIEKFNERVVEKRVESYYREII